jgi:16S rRNA (adenine1518-N6/adenine1519-N6)-dimethyltransferase
MSTQGKRRAYGQHFLRDRALCLRIAQQAFQLARESGCKRMLEIGPGRGAITLPILDAWTSESGGMSEFLLVERDLDLARHWQDQAQRIREEALPGSAPLRVECADMVEIPETLWLEPGPLAVVSNLPYSAGTAIVERLARRPETIPFMLLMFQAEVAQRLRAEPSTKSWGSLSVWIQNRWDVEKFATVPPGAFQPPPEVMSEIVILRRRAQPRVRGTTDSPAAAEIWEKLLRTCFAHRRKMLRSGLPKSGPWLSALEASGIDPTRRAETLDWPEWEGVFLKLAPSAVHAWEAASGESGA